MPIQRVLSKQAKTAVLLQSEALQAYIPVTKSYSKESLKSLLDEYGMVYVKPDGGTFGIGVIKVQKLQGGYQFQTGTKVHSHSTFDGLFAGLENIRPKKRYVVQQGIHLLKHRSRRFDLRVMVQKNLAGAWETTGIIGRLGHPSKIVTNYHSGGTITPFETLLSGHMDSAEQKRFQKELQKLGVETGQQLTKRYPGLKEIGLDIAVSTSLKPWILEVNTMPDPYIFRKLRDKSIFRRMRRYAAAYSAKKK